MIKQAVKQGGRTDIAEEIAAAQQRTGLQPPSLSLVDDNFISIGQGLPNALRCREMKFHRVLERR
jgi:hypothetical protein